MFTDFIMNTDTTDSSNIIKLANVISIFETDENFKAADNSIDKIKLFIATDYGSFINPETIALGDLKTKYLIDFKNKRVIEVGIIRVYNWDNSVE